MYIEKVTAVILAGGKSSRFGQDKSLLKINGRLLMEQNIEKCRTFANEIFIAGNCTNKFCIPGTREIRDIHPGIGPLGGIHASLSCASNDTVFFVACDMPCFSTELAKCLIAGSDGYKIYIPVSASGPEPLFGVYRKGVLPLVSELISHGEYRLRTLLESTDTGYLDVRQAAGDNPFYNVNYPEDWDTLMGSTHFISKHCDCVPFAFP